MKEKKDLADNFEADLDQLETIVKTLESGELNLNDNIKQYEAGIVLYKKCREALNEAEKKITTLSKSLEETERE